MNAYREKLLSVGYLSRGRSGSRVSEGRAHPETGKPFKATTDELGNTVVEHATSDDRVDAHVRPETVRAKFNLGA